MNTTIDWTEIEKGTEVRVEGVRGVFAFCYVRNNEVTVYGGDRNPNGIRMFRTFTPERVRVYRPRSETRKMQPSVLPTPTTRGRRR